MASPFEPRASISDTSLSRAAKSSPIPSSPLIIRSPRSRARSVTTTLAPCSASLRALARPLPFGRPAPVTIATFPFKRLMLFLHLPLRNAGRLFLDSGVHLGEGLRTRRNQVGLPARLH